MRRRRFLQSSLAAIAAFFVPVAKADLPLIVKFVWPGGVIDCSFVCSDCGNTMPASAQPWIDHEEPWPGHCPFCRARPFSLSFDSIEARRWKNMKRVLGKDRL